MRRTYAHRYFKCSCGIRFGKVIEIYPNPVLEVGCECGNPGIPPEEVIAEKDQHLFRPFWSDTLQARISDREDLKKLKSYAKSHGLINVGHLHQRPDRTAIRHNFEN